MAVRDSAGLYLEVLEAAPAAGVPLEFEVYDGASPGTHLATIEHARHGSFASLLSEVGAGEFRLLRSDPKATSAILAEGNVVRCKTGGIDRYAFFIEEPAEVVTSEHEASGEEWTIAGRGLLAYLERACVYPPVWPLVPAAYRSSSVATNGTGATSLTVAKPAGAISGDVLIAAITFVGGDAKLPTTPSDWDLIANRENGSALGLALYRRAAASADTGWTWLFPASVAASAAIIALPAASADITTYGASFDTGSGTSINCPSRSVGLVDGALLTIAATTANAAITPAAGLTEAADQAAAGRSIEAAYLLNPALGDTGDKVATAGATGSWIGASLIIPSSGVVVLEFKGSTFGGILSALIDAAQARGALPHLTYDFSATADSAGQPWPDTHDLAFHVGTSLLDVWRHLVALGLEGAMTPSFKLQAWVDRSRHFESSVILRKGKHLRGNVTRTTHGSARRTRGLVEGAGGRLVEVSDISAEADGRIGRRESFVTLTTSDDPTDLSVAGSASIELSTLEARAMELPVHHGSAAEGHFEPWVDYREGDYIGLDAAGIGEVTVERIVGIAAKQEGADYAVELALNALALTNQTRLRRMLDAIAGRGNASGGGAAAFGLGGAGSSGGSSGGGGTVAVQAGDTPGFLFDKIEVVGIAKSVTGSAGAKRLQLTGARPGIVGGYAPLSSGLLVPVAYLGSGTPDSTKFLRGDGTWAVPSGGSDPDAPPAPTGNDDEFTALTGWTTLGTLDTLNVTDRPGLLHMVKANSGGIYMDGIYKACPAVPFTVTARLRAFARNANYKSAGIFVGDGDPGKMYTVFLPQTTTYSGRATYDQAIFTNRTTRATVAEAYIDPVAGGWPEYMRMIVTSGTNVTLQYSMDKLVWVTVWSAQNPALGTPAVFGLWISGNAAGVGAEAYFDWIRYGANV